MSAFSGLLGLGPQSVHFRYQPGEIVFYEMQRVRPFSQQLSDLLCPSFDLLQILASHNNKTPSPTAEVISMSDAYYQPSRKIYQVNLSVFVG
jgi:hypothetical protein